jgi:hypothetical protein
MISFSVKRRALQVLGPFPKQIPDILNQKEFVAKIRPGDWVLGGQKINDLGFCGKR